MPKITDIEYDSFSLRLPKTDNADLVAISRKYKRSRNQCAATMIALVLSDPELQTRCFGSVPPP